MKRPFPFESTPLSPSSGPDAARSTSDPHATAVTLDSSVTGTAPAGPRALASQPSSEVDPLDRAEPTRVGRYVIIRRLGQGAMAVVYLAYDPKLDRKVALKLLREDLATDKGRARVQREAQAMAQVSHPHIAHVYEVGESAGQLYIVMEYIAGTSLAAWQRARASESASVEQILRIYLQAGAGLLAAHRAGLIHRDFKPDNVSSVEKLGFLVRTLTLYLRTSCARDWGLTAVRLALSESMPVAAAKGYIFLRPPYTGPRMLEDHEALAARRTMEPVASAGATKEHFYAATVEHHLSERSDS